jgi:hypothetical protein
VLRFDATILTNARLDILLQVPEEWRDRNESTTKDTNESEALLAQIEACN